MTLTTFLTAGQASATEAQILESVESTGPRLITVNIASPSPGLDARNVQQIEDIEGVSWVLALGPATDMRSTVLGTTDAVPVRELLSGLPPEVKVNKGRSPRAGEAILGTAPMSALRLEEPAGALTTRFGEVVNVVGAFEASGAVSGLDRLVLIAPATADTSKTTLLYVLADEALSVEHVVSQVRALASVGSGDELSVQTSAELIELGRVVSGQVGSFGRQVAVGTIGVGMVLVGLTTALAALARRRDIGRGRALGASRSVVVALALLETVIPSFIGAILGSAAGVVAVVALSGTFPPPSFYVGAVVLIVLSSACATIPATIRAARSDPVRVLRVP